LRHGPRSRNRSLRNVGQGHGLDDLLSDHLVQIAGCRDQRQDENDRDDHHHFHQGKTVATYRHFFASQRHPVTGS